MSCLNAHDFISGNRRRDAAKRVGFIGAHQGGVTDHIGGKNCGKPAFHAHSPSIRRLTAIDQRIHAAEKALECPLMAICRHSDGCPEASALASITDISRAKLRPNHKAPHFSHSNTLKRVTS